MRYGKRSWTAIDALVPQIHVALNVALFVRLEGNKSLTGDFRSRITETVFRAHIAYRRSENTVCTRTQKIYNAQKILQFLYIYRRFALQRGSTIRVQAKCCGNQTACKQPASRQKRNDKTRAQGKGTKQPIWRYGGIIWHLQRNSQQDLRQQCFLQAFSRPHVTRKYPERSEVLRHRE